MDRNECWLYTDIIMSEDDLLDLIHKKYGGKRGAYEVECDWAEFYIEENDHSWIKKKNKLDGFLYYRYIIFVEFRIKDKSFDTFFANLCDLISTLKEIGAKVVPACDFEDELNMHISP